MAAAATRTVKGSVILARLAFVTERLGPEGVQRVLARLAAPDRGVVGGLVLPAGWYSFDTTERLDAAIAAETGLGDEAFRLMGRASAQKNLAEYHRTFIRDGDPHGLLRSAAGIYRLYYATGRRTYESLGPKKAILRTYESETYSRSDCLTVVGWHEKAIELCGGRHVRVAEPRCRARGDELCEYVCEWS